LRQIRKFALIDGRVPFDDWLSALELSVRARIRAYIDRVALGGARWNVKRLKNRDGVMELAIDSGPGYRVYYAEIGKSLILLLNGGTKRTQERDIESATKNWRLYRAQTQHL
jgi:putative addiction module killer protein